MPPSPHAWMAPMVEDMLHHSKTGLPEAVVMGPGNAILFCRRQSLGEGLSWVRWETAFTLTGADSWVGKSAHLATNPITIWEGQQVIAQAITECQIEARGPGHPHSCLTTPSHSDSIMEMSPPRKNVSKMSALTINHHLTGHQEAGIVIGGKETQGWYDPSHPHLPQIMDSKVTEGWYQQPDQYHHNLTGKKAPSIPVMADIEGKPEATWKSIYPSLKMMTWRMPSPTKVEDGTWLYTTMQGCQDCTLLPYAIWSLQGYPGELIRSSRTDKTLDDVLTILDEHYNNVKALDALNQELFQLQMGKKENILDWGVCLSRHLQVLSASFPECFPPDHIAKLKCDCFYGRLPKWLKAMVVYLKASPQEKMYSNYLQAMREAKKVDSMERFQSQTAENAAKPKVTSFFPLWKLKGTQPAVKMSAVCLVHLEEESTKKDEGVIVRILMILKVSQRNSWCIWWGLWKTPKRERNAAITVAS